MSSRIQRAQEVLAAADAAADTAAEQCSDTADAAYALFFVADDAYTKIPTGSAVESTPAGDAHIASLWREWRLEVDTYEAAVATHTAAEKVYDAAAEAARTALIEFNAEVEAFLAATTAARANRAK